MGTTYTLSGSLGDVIDGGVSSVHAAYVRTNLPDDAALIDKTADAGGIKPSNIGRIPLAGDAFSVVLLGTSNTGMNVAANTLRYEVVVEYGRPGEKGLFSWRSGWFPLTADADLKDIAPDLELVLPGSAGGAGGSLIVSAGGTIDLDNGVANGTLIGYRFTNTATVEGATVAAGSYMFTRETDTTKAPLGWYVKALDEGVALSAGPPDVTAPTAGTLAGSAITATGATTTVTGASDAVALHASPYSFSKDNGTTWTAYQSSNAYAWTGLTSGTAYQMRHRVKDAAGNVTTGTAITVTTTVVLTTDFLDTFARANGALSTAPTPDTGGTWAGSTAGPSISSGTLTSTGGQTIYASRGSNPAREVTYDIVTTSATTTVVGAWATNTGTSNGPKCAVLPNGQVSFQGIIGATFNVQGGTNAFTSTGYLSYATHAVKIVTNADGTCHLIIDGVTVVSGTYSTALTERYVAVTLNGTIDNLTVKA